MKKIIAVLISIILICSSFLSVVGFAEESSVADASYDTPIVVVRGMAFGGLTINEGTPAEREAVILPDTNEIVSLVINLAKTYFMEKRLDVDAIVDVADKAIGSLACDENGDSLYNASYTKYPNSAAVHTNLFDDEGVGEFGVVSAAMDTYGADKVYFFTYDWRLDPTDTADDLNVMIEKAKADHNSDKVDIVCCSMGGVITDCYIYEYGCESIDTVIFDSTAFCGTHLTTDLFQGKVVITAEMLKYFLGDLIGNELITNVLYSVGLLDVVADFAMKIVDEYKGEVYDKFLRDVFATMPIMWAIAQQDEYEACVEYIFPTDELKAKYEGLLNRTNNLHEVMSGMDELLLTLPDKGVKVAVVAGYNSPMPPVYASAMVSGDTVLESDFMLGRATVADLGKTLGDDYVGERVSPDKCVDLSNVLFPEYTWAIRNGSHIIGKYGTDSADLIMTILGSKEQPTVTSFEKYPQFMIADANMNLTYFD